MNFFCLVHNKIGFKVVETTRCSIAQAEIALYDADNNVEEAVNAILEDTYTDSNVWKEQKSRKAKKQDCDEKNEELVGAHRNDNRSHPPTRGTNYTNTGSLLTVSKFFVLIKNCG